MIKAAIFDMDGTLIDSLIFWEFLWKTLGDKYLGDPNFRPDASADRECRTLTLAQAMTLVYERFGLGSSARELADFTTDLLRRFYTDVVEAKPGAVAFLQHLKDKGVKMAVATASNGELVELAMKRCGLEGFFDAVVSCATVGKGKDAPDVFLLTLDTLGTKAEETWMFEDSYVALQTAKGIGMPTVGIFDANNYGQDILRQNSDHYIAEGEMLTRLIGVLEC
jgi:HAD superfamily hydrolase (TIGR01509 family)